MNIFISHAWDRSDLYTELIELLNQSEGLHWKNVSIPANEAFVLANAQEAFQQRSELARRRQSAIATRLRLIAERRSALQAHSNELARERIEALNVINADQLIAAAEADILRSGASEAIRSLQALKRVHSIPAAINQLEAVTQRLEGVENQIKQLQSEHASLESDANILLRNFRDSDQVVLGKSGTAMTRNYEQAPNLALAISNRIAEADVVILIALRNSAFLRWIEFEYEETIRSRKPIFAILHQSQGSKIAPDLRMRGIPEVEWSGEALQRRLASIPH